MLSDSSTSLQTMNKTLPLSFIPEGFAKFQNIEYFIVIHWIYRPLNLIFVLFAPFLRPYHPQANQLLAVNWVHRSENLLGFIQPGNVPIRSYENGKWWGQEKRSILMERKMRLALQFGLQPYFCDDYRLKFPIIGHFEDFGTHIRLTSDQHYVTRQPICAHHQQW